MGGVFGQRGEGARGGGMCMYLLRLKPLFWPNGIRCPCHFLGGGGYSISCMTAVCNSIHARTPAMRGRSTSGFRPPGKEYLHHARIAVRSLANRGKGEMLCAKNRCVRGGG